jgi:hypothetical protein
MKLNFVVESKNVQRLGQIAGTLTTFQDFSTLTDSCLPSESQILRMARPDGQIAGEMIRKSVPCHLAF